MYSESSSGLFVPENNLVKPENIRGGADSEKLYKQDLLRFRLPSGEFASVRKTDIPGVDMTDLTVRHEARYYLALINTPTNTHVLDFPCGSGYGAPILTARTGVTYEGREIDPVTVAYAQQVYGGEKATFIVGNMRSPNLQPEAYDMIACLEGYEHVKREYQQALLNVFYESLKPGGTLVISSPENPAGISGPSAHNPYHLSELTGDDFIQDIYGRFGEKNVIIVPQIALASTHVTLHMLYGICKKPA